MQFSDIPEPLVALGGLLIAVVVFQLVHRTAMKHLQNSSEKKTILSMELVAFGLLMASFMGGEVVKLARAVRAPQAPISLGLETGDMAMVAGCLLGSLLIYVGVVKLLG